MQTIRETAHHSKTHALGIDRPSDGSRLGLCYRRYAPPSFHIETTARYPATKSPHDLLNHGGAIETERSDVKRGI
ncbi:hypothetical protein R3X27_21265 [Tropicimonas sp. TH_r6]|uniref:hypothetical protein n=1 Tax=Tropicimonas sp. TH_r6 TaxID=3082085 RepID=UPI00295577D8|nr:hypothetical protein [Tropicimonas sp. TH_r6]MDV7145221.1 hypothetical protein [Tropicimonas sp. TH_r6]